MPTLLTNPLRSHIGNSTSPIETREDHLRAEEGEDTHRAPQDHPQVVVVEEAEAAAVVVAEEHSCCLGTHRPNLLKNS